MKCPLPDWPFASPYGTLMPTTQTSEMEGKEGNPFGVMPLLFWRGKERGDPGAVDDFTRGKCLLKLK